MRHWVTYVRHWVTYVCHWVTYVRHWVTYVRHWVTYVRRRGGSSHCGSVLRGAELENHELCRGDVHARLLEQVLLDLPKHLITLSLALVLLLGL